MYVTSIVTQWSDGTSIGALIQTVLVSRILYNSIKNKNKNRSNAEPAFKAYLSS